MIARVQVLIEILRKFQQLVPDTTLQLWPSLSVDRDAAAWHEVGRLDRLPKQTRTLPASPVSMQEDVAFRSREELHLGRMRFEDGSQDLHLSAGIQLGRIHGVGRAMVTAEVDERVRHQLLPLARPVGSVSDHPPRLERRLPLPR